MLREFGVGKSILEDKIREEIEHFMAEIERQDGKPLNPHHTIMYATSNIMGSLTFGKRLDYNSEKFKRYMDIMIECFTVSWTYMYSLLLSLKLRGLQGLSF